MKVQFLLAALLVCTFIPLRACADEGGVSFWLPGNFGSFVAAPGDPGWTLPIIYYYTSADAGADKTFPRAGRVTAGVDASGSFVFVAPTYTLTTPVAGGQASWGLAVAFGHLNADVDATLTGPLGSVLSGSESDARTGVSDFYPTASLKWNRGVHNSMVYLMAGVPVGAYDVGRLANLGTNHGAIDGGGGYTYLDPKKGRELSAALGFTYNFENPDTQYRNGFSSHLDWAASRFVSKALHVGVVGYVYYQITGVSGSGAKLGDFKSQVAGLGPQAGRFFEMGGRKWYVNLKSYWEFGAKNRPDGWNAWLALAIPLTEKK
jgi:hypothetical protein